MRVRLDRVATNRFGRRAERIELLDVPELTVGRGTDNRLHISDPTVALHHVAFIEEPDGIRAVRRAASELLVDGTPTDAASLRLGTVVQIGGWALKVVEPKGDEHLHLEITGPPPAALKTLPRPVAPVGDNEPIARKRLSWALSLAFLAVVLILPLLYRNARDTFLVAPIATLRDAAWRAQASWTVGHLTEAHSHIVDDDACCATPASCKSQPYKTCDRCASCHAVAFERVQDADCIGCHSNVGAHIAPVRAARVAPSALPELSEARCTTCHHEHEGDAELIESANRFCTGCHADLQRRFPLAELENVADFATHPQFKPAVFTQLDGASRSRVSLSALVACPSDPRLGTMPGSGERSGIEFSHAKHLRAIRGPSGTLEILTCANCHTPSDDGKLMRKATFVNNCERCHALTFVGAAAGHEAPHTQPARVAAAIWEYFAGQLVNSEQPAVARGQEASAPRIKRAKDQNMHPSGIEAEVDGATWSVPADSQVGSTGTSIWERFAAQAATNLEQPAITGGGIPLPGIHQIPPPTRLQSVMANAARASENLLGEKGSCQMCHTAMDLTRRDREVLPVFVVPMEEETRWLPRAQFTHAAHERFRCESCHEAAPSAEATWQVMLPGVEKCRECHVDETVRSGKVASRCLSCHRFHDRMYGPMKTGING